MKNIVKIALAFGLITSATSSALAIDHNTLFASNDIRTNSTSTLVGSTSNPVKSAAAHNLVFASSGLINERNNDRSVGSTFNGFNNEETQSKPRFSSPFSGISR